VPLDFAQAYGSADARNPVYTTPLNDTLPARHRRRAAGSAMAPAEYGSQGGDNRACCFRRQPEQAGSALRDTPK